MTTEIDLKVKLGNLKKPIFAPHTQTQTNTQPNMHLTCQCLK